MGNLFDRLFKKKSTRYLSLLLVLLPFLLLTGFFGYRTVDSIKNIVPGESGSVAKKDTEDIEDYDYHLRHNATDLQKELFKELDELLDQDPQDELAISESIAKNYIADFYTWTNKEGQYDVGGMYYVFSDSRPNIYYQARDSYYHYLSSYIEEYGQENLLEVTSVEVETSGPANEFTDVFGRTYPAWYVRVRYTYADHPNFPIGEYYTVMNITVVKRDNGRFEIAQAYGDN